MSMTHCRWEGGGRGGAGWRYVCGARERYQRRCATLYFPKRNKCTHAATSRHARISERTTALAASYSSIYALRWLHTCTPSSRVGTTTSSWGPCIAVCSRMRQGKSCQDGCTPAQRQRSGPQPAVSGSGRPGRGSNQVIVCSNQAAKGRGPCSLGNRTLRSSG